MHIVDRFVLTVFTFIFSTGLCTALENSIEIKDLTSSAADNQVKIQCEISYQLDDKVKEALRNGIEMTFRLEIELMQINTYWLDEKRATMTREFNVKYHALSKQYVMKQTGSDVEHIFPDLYSAFYFQRYLHNAVLSGFGRLQSDAQYYLRARARLVSEQLPLPLRIKSYLYSSWRPSSGWSVWPI